MLVAPVCLWLGARVFSAPGAWSGQPVCLGVVALSERFGLLRIACPFWTGPRRAAHEVAETPKEQRGHLSSLARSKTCILTGTNRSCCPAGRSCCGRHERKARVVIGSSAARVR